MFTLTDEPESTAETLVVVTSIVEINPNGGDDAALINAALADPTVTEVRLSAGTFIAHTAIVVPSGKTLTGAGRDQTRIEAASDFQAISNQHNGVVNSAWGAVDVTLADFSVDVNKVSPSGLRINGVMMKQATGFDIARVDVYNATGYAHFAQGNLDTQLIRASGAYDDCRTFNSQVHFEQMFCENITLTNCHARDGDNDISTEAYFHPLAGSRNITFEDCSAVGNGFIGFSIVSNVQPLENIHIINTEIDITRAQSGFGIVALGPLATLNLDIVNSSFVSDNYIGATLAGVTGQAVDSEFRGRVMGIESGDTYTGVETNFVAYDSLALGIASNPQPVGVYGIVNYGDSADLSWVGGTIEAIGQTGYMAPVQNVTTSQTEILNNGFDGTRVQKVGGSPLTVFGGVPVAGSADHSFAGGTLSLLLQKDPASADQVNIVSTGSGNTGLVVQGADLLFNGAIFGTLSYNSEGRGLDVELDPSASTDAVAALLDAITFSGGSGGGAMRSVSASLTMTDSLGESFDTYVRLVVSPATLTGTTGADWLLGSDDGHEFILAAGGNEVVQSGAGADTFYFGQAMTTDDLVMGGAGTDTVVIQGDYSGSQQLTLWTNVTGVEVVQVLSGSNTQFGDLSGASYSYEVRANDAIVAPGSTVTVDGAGLKAGENLTYDGSLETDGKLKLLGGSGDDTLKGGAGGDFLDGGSGQDNLIGGAGNDIYYVNSTDKVTETAGGGFDAAYTTGTFALSSVSEVELLATLDHGSTQNLQLYGNEFNNSINGNSGSNSLYGGAGDDTLRGLGGTDVLDGGTGRDYMVGGGGDDRYYVDEDFDTVIEAAGEGYDRLYSVSSYTLPGDSEVELLAASDYRTTTNISLSGNQLNNSISGNNGNNILDGRDGMDSLRGFEGNDLLIGGGGVDYMIGGVGDDSYRADAGDSVVEDAGGGFDTVYALSSVALTGGSEVELLRTFNSNNTEVLDLTGNEFGQSLAGNQGDNLLLGKGGADSISGLGGNDRIDGGAGQDHLTGGAGDDIFVLGAVADSSLAGADTIADFSSGSDRIDLSLIDANTTNPGNDPFAFIGGDAFSSHAGELRFDSATSAIYGDINGDGVADFQIIVLGSVVASDFLL